VSAAAAVAPEPLVVSSTGFIWTMSQTMHLAADGCPSCGGFGMRFDIRNHRPCECVCREIFRRCLHAWQKLIVVPDPHCLEFCADFWLVAKRHLDEWHWNLFCLHFIEGREWRDCLLPLRTDRGKFFHAVYRVEAQLGRAYRELRPYALFPIGDYFSKFESTKEGE
jgi:hypothetical protein